MSAQDDAEGLYVCPNCGDRHDSLMWSRCCSDACEAEWVREHGGIDG